MSGYDGDEFGYYGPIRSPEPTEWDYCDMGGHRYDGDDGEGGRCRCCDRQYPVGGPVEIIGSGTATDGHDE